MHHSAKLSLFLMNLKVAPSAVIAWRRDFENLISLFWMVKLGFLILYRSEGMRHIMKFHKCQCSGMPFFRIFGFNNLTFSFLSF